MARGIVVVGAAGAVMNGECVTDVQSYARRMVMPSGWYSNSKSEKCKTTHCWRTEPIEGVTKDCDFHRSRVRQLGGSTKCCFAAAGKEKRVMSSSGGGSHSSIVGGYSARRNQPIEPRVYFYVSPAVLSLSLAPSCDSKIRNDMGLPRS